MAVSSSIRRRFSERIRAQLVGACDGLIVVMRAEPLAHLTLPALLELVQRVRGRHALKTHGVLLTLPDGEVEGGRWESELRGRLGGRVSRRPFPLTRKSTMPPNSDGSRRRRRRRRPRWRGIIALRKR